MLTPADATVLIVSEDSTNAAIVDGYLQGEVGRIVIVSPGDAVSTFDTLRPHVMIFALKDVEAAETCYLDFYNFSGVIYRHPHGTILLCQEAQVREAFDLCEDGTFDDYMAMWPLSDCEPGLRLRTHIRNLLPSIGGEQQNDLAVNQFAEELRALNGLEDFFEQQLDSVQSRIDALDVAVSSEHPNKQALNTETAISRALGPLREWPHEFREASRPFAGAGHTLGSIVAHRPSTILVVDDEVFLHQALIGLLADQNCRFRFATNGRKALELLRRIDRPDLILMDIMLPGINGIQMVRLLRASEPFASIPIIMLTSRSERESVAESMGAGANDYIVKPFSGNTLINKVSRFLHESA